jgi:uncharacterized membrane protein YeaQ/YmgE (transglycosylase-associated protein family)
VFDHITITRMLMNLTALIMQLVGGALAGYAAGHLSKEISLGVTGNCIVGALVGAIGGQLLFAGLGLGGSVQVMSALLTGAVSGGIGMLVAGFLKAIVFTPGGRINR